MTENENFGRRGYQLVPGTNFLVPGTKILVPGTNWYPPRPTPHIISKTHRMNCLNFSYFQVYLYLFFDSSYDDAVVTLTTSNKQPWA